MATTHEIAVERRSDEGKGASRRLRRVGKVPAIVYGGTLAPVSIQIEHKDAWAASQNEWFYSAIFALNLGGDRQKVLLRDMQRHPYKQQLLHMDFQRISDDEIIRVRVPIHFLNQEKSPAGKTSGVVVMRELTDVEVACLPKDLPESIELDLGELAVGDTIHLSQLPLPAGVEIPQLKLGKEHDIAVVVARMAREEVEPETEEGEEGAADAAPAADAAREEKKEDRK